MPSRRGGSVRRARVARALISISRGFTNRRNGILTASSGIEPHVIYRSYSWKVKAPQSSPPFLFHEEWEKVRGAQRVRAEVKPAPASKRLRLSKLQHRKP